VASSHQRYLSSHIQIGIKWTEPLTSEFVRAVMAEGLGMVMFLYITVSMILFRNGTSGDGAPYPVTDASWAFGASIIVLVYSMAGISGANLNPAVTIAITVVKKITFQRCIAYVFVQMWGAYIGARIAKSLRPSGGSAPWNHLAEGVNVNQAMLAEVMGTFCLVWVVMAAIDPGRGTKIVHLGPLAPLAIGMTVFVLHLGMIGIDNCSINPARSFGTSLAFGEFPDHWIFWVGPITGGILAALTYEVIFKEFRGIGCFS
jgi:MIP family channel proteins